MQTENPYHRHLQRQLRKFFPEWESQPENVRQFVLAVDDSYKLFENNRLLVERAMRLGSEELQEKNLLLLHEKERQEKVIYDLVEAVQQVFPDYTPEGDADLRRIVDIIKQAIDTQKRSETDLRKARQIAENSLETRKLFLANISHEIRTPMNAISGMAQLLSESNLTPVQRDYLNAIIASSEGLMVIINDLLHMSKIESGKFSLERISFEPEKIMQSLLRGQSVKAREKGIQLQYEPDARIASFLVGDPTRLTQVLSNLISNAIKFTEKGTVTVRLSVIEKTEKMQHIRFDVIDTGIGIEAEKVNSVFEEFTQEDVSITRKYGGTGLGLSISKTLVELMGGQLSVNSIKNEGSTFSFELLLPVGSATHSPGPLPGKEKNLPDLRVLLVEDNEMNRFLAITLLTRWKAKVYEAVNGKQAVEWLKTNSADIVLMDLQMPEMDGFVATRAIRAELQLQVPIIALTANALEVEREKCLEAGMNAYLSKPYSPDALYKIIEEQLPKKIAYHSSSKTIRLSLDRIFQLYEGNHAHVRKTADVFIRQMESDLALLEEKVHHLEYRDILALLHKMTPGVELFQMQDILSVFAFMRQSATARNAGQLVGHLADLHGLLALARIRLYEELAAASS
jgi:two-component system, sensor histidine kinase